MDERMDWSETSPICSFKLRHGRRLFDWGGWIAVVWWRGREGVRGRVRGWSLWVNGWELLHFVFYLVFWGGVIDVSILDAPL